MNSKELARDIVISKLLLIVGLMGSGYLLRTALGALPEELITGHLLILLVAVLVGINVWLLVWGLRGLEKDRFYAARRERRDKKRRRKSKGRFR